MSVRTELVAAVIARISSASFPALEVDDLDAMTQLPADYAEVHLSSRTPGLRRLSARGQRFGWRLLIRVNASSVNNANVLVDRVHDLLYDTVLMTASSATTRLDEIPASPSEFDDGYYSTLLEFTFTH